MADSCRGELTSAKIFDYSSISSENENWRKLRDTWGGGIQNLKDEMHRFGLDDVFGDEDAVITDWERRCSVNMSRASDLNLFYCDVQESGQSFIGFTADRGRDSDFDNTDYYCALPATNDERHVSIIRRDRHFR